MEREVLKFVAAAARVSNAEKALGTAYSLPVERRLVGVGVVGLQLLH